MALGRSSRRKVAIVDSRGFLKTTKYMDTAPDTTRTGGKVTKVNGVKVS